MKLAQGMTRQEIYDEVKAEFKVMTLPSPHIPIEIANAKIAAYNAYKVWLDNNRVSQNGNETTDSDCDYFAEIYNSPY